MGIKLVQTVMSQYAALSGSPFKVLLRMAWTALDDKSAKGQPAELYFGGWEPLAMALGLEVPAEDRSDQAVTARRKKLATRVTDELRKLRDLGVVEAVDRAHTGTRQTYRLHLYATQDLGPTSHPGSGSLCHPGSGFHEPPRIEVQSHPGSGSPRKNSGGTEDEVQDFTSRASSSTSGVARELEAGTPSSEEVRDVKLHERLQLIAARHSGSASALASEDVS